MSELDFDGTPLHTLIACAPAPATAVGAPPTARAAPYHAAAQPPTPAPHTHALLLAERIQQAHAAVLAAHDAIARHQLLLAEESAGTRLDR
ncbi:hypothetical protein [Streptomyces sp. SCL15-4]|uniref:hypothetical protein n=1 Tax=Streptomyces sp. SCL15-4 TaxID=2967221 RepID=UPI00296697D1|nr:hypothetical protein [Streptomyces sp. SCL15-4]